MGMWEDIKKRIKNLTSKKVDTKELKTESSFLVYRKIFDTGDSYKVNPNKNLQIILPPNGQLSGSDTIQGDGTIIGFEL